MKTFNTSQLFLDDKHRKDAVAFLWLSIKTSTFEIQMFLIQA